MSPSQCLRSRITACTVRASTVSPCFSKLSLTICTTLSPNLIFFYVSVKLDLTSSAASLAFALFLVTFQLGQLIISFSYHHFFHYKQHAPNILQMIPLPFPPLNFPCSRSVWLFTWSPSDQWSQTQALSNQSWEGNSCLPK